MSAVTIREATLDRDKWLEKQIFLLKKELSKLPSNNRGPFVISDDALSSKKVHSSGRNKLKLLK